MLLRSSLISGLLTEGSSKTKRRGIGLYPDLLRKVKVRKDRRLSKRIFQRLKALFYIIRKRIQTSLNTVLHLIKKVR
jgi:hypothetical protein